jgi:thiol-disulfide isomerase/thioredoxin
MAKITNTCVLLSTAILLLCFPHTIWTKEPELLSMPGKIFPDFTFHTRLEKEELHYLGIPQRRFLGFLGRKKTQSFTVMDIQADLVILEFFNVHCISCQAHAPLMNRVYSLIQKDKILKERVKVVAVASGNNSKEIEKFRKEKKISFPLIADPKYDAYEEIGEPYGTPLFFLVRKGEKEGITVLIQRHIHDPAYFVQETWNALNADLTTMVASTREKSAKKTVREYTPPFITEEELKTRVKKSMASRGVFLEESRKITLADRGEIFMGKTALEAGEKTFFSKIISRNPVCDVCHEIHFILTFDSQGTVVDIIPLHFTKYGNIEWNKDELRKVTSTLIEKSLLEPIQFDPEVDAVSGATMTTSLVFNSVERAEKDYRELQQKGYIQ